MNLNCLLTYLVVLKGPLPNNLGSELPLNVKNIEKYETFSAKCSKYYFDKDIACVLSKNNY